jgi:hypothetical protein
MPMMHHSGQGISDAYYCKECTIMEKDRDGCPKIVNLGSAKTDLFYERKKVLFFPAGFFLSEPSPASQPHISKVPENSFRTFFIFAVWVQEGVVMIRLQNRAL